MIKLGFVTCVELGLSCMEEIYKQGAELALAITLEDDQAVNKSGRVYLDGFCQKNKITLVKSRHINNLDVIDAVHEYQIDWLFVIGWSQIASSDLLASPKLGVLGMHPTLLPEGRGRAAIPWAILKGLEKTGVTLFKLDQGVDTGPVLDSFEIQLGNDITATQLYEKVNRAHRQLMGKVIYRLLDGSVKLTNQCEFNATEWPGRKPSDGKIDFDGSVVNAERLVRAVTRPYPGAFFFRRAQKVIVWKAEITSKNEGQDIIKFSDGYLLILDYEIEA